jgi:hypothetical protein
MIMESQDPYESFKRGIAKDTAGLAINAAGAFGFFFFILLLLMIFWFAIAPNSPANETERLFSIAFLVVIVPCLFIKRIANIIISIWGVILILIVSGVILVPLCYFTYTMFSIAFGFK